MSLPEIDERFIAERIVGSGGMGVVYRAQDTRENRLVAIKLLKNVEDVVGFLREAALLADLRHPRIAQYVSSGLTKEGVPFLAMEWLDGETLGTHLARKRLRLDEATTLIGNIAAGLVEAHDRGIIHQDIKPSNLFLPSRKLECVKILDFGIARRFTARTSLEAHTIAGTPGYMAPEQASSYGRIDARIDIFALGCVFFECLTGRLPYHSDDSTAKLVRKPIARALPVNIPNVPPAITALAGRMVARKAADRPVDARALLAELAELDHELSRHAEVGFAAFQTPSAISSREQRVFSVLLMAGVRDGAEAGWEAITLAHGGEIFLLAGGTRLITFPALSLPADALRRGAQCALAVRDCTSNPPAMVLTAGLGYMLEDQPIGPFMEAALKLLERTAPGEIRIGSSATTFLDAGFRLEYRRHGPLLRRHSSQASGRFPRPVLGKKTTMVGRDRELAELEAFWRQCVDESTATTVLITAPPGLGKSRLRHEFLARIRAHTPELTLLQGTVDSLSQGTPWGHLTCALRLLAGITNTDESDDARRKLVQAVTRSGKLASRTCAFLGELAKIAFPDEDLAELRMARADCRLMADQVRVAWLDWLELTCVAHPVLVVLEDFQWGDLATVQLIDETLRVLSDRPIFVMALARPEIESAFPKIWSARPTCHIHLAALGNKASRKLFEEILGNNGSPAILDRLVALAGGNPFYIEEIAHMFLEEGNEAIPDSVVTMEHARLNGLPAEQKLVLKAASVFGKSFAKEGVCALLEETTHVEALLGKLVRREILDVSTGGGYAFRHHIVRDAAYSLLTESDRVLAHRRAGGFLEMWQGTNAASIAEHFWRGADLAGAAKWYLQAAAQALESNDIGMAQRYAENGISYGPPDAQQSVFLLFLAQVEFWRGENVLAEQHALRALEKCDVGSTIWFQAVRELISALGEQARYLDVQSWTERVFAMLNFSCATVDQLRCLVRGMWFLVLGGKYELAEEILARLKDAPASSDPLVKCVIHRLMTVRATAIGRPAQAVIHCENALRALEALGDMRQACECRNDLGYLLGELGQFDRSENVLRLALEQASRLGLSYPRAAALQNLVPVLAARRSYEEASCAGLAAVDLFEEQHNLRMIGVTKLYLATVAYRAGDAMKSECLARAAVDQLTGVLPFMAYALAVLARAKLSLEKRAEALELATRANAMVDSMGRIEEGESLVRLILVEALAAVGDGDNCQVALAQALRSICVRAQAIEDAQLRESFLTCIPENARIMALAQAAGLVTPAALS